jgi:formate dehydrogenase subunit gamma
VNWAKQHHILWLQEEQARTGPNESESQSRARPAATPAE